LLIHVHVCCSIEGISNRGGKEETNTTQKTNQV